MAGCRCTIRYRGRDGWHQGNWLSFSCVVLGFDFSYYAWIRVPSPAPFSFLNCCLPNSGMCCFITPDWLSSIVTIICGSSRHLRIEIDLGQLYSRGMMAVVTAPVAKATALWFWGECFSPWAFSRRKEDSYLHIQIPILPYSLLIKDHFQWEQSRDKM